MQGKGSLEGRIPPKLPEGVSVAKCVLRVCIDAVGGMFVGWGRAQETETGDHGLHRDQRETELRRCGRREGMGEEGKRPGQRRPGSLGIKSLQDSAQPPAATLRGSPTSWPRRCSLIHQRVPLSKMGVG